MNDDEILALPEHLRMWVIFHLDMCDAWQRFDPSRATYENLETQLARLRRPDYIIR